MKTTKRKRLTVLTLVFLIVAILSTSVAFGATTSLWGSGGSEGNPYLNTGTVLTETNQDSQAQKIKETMDRYVLVNSNEGNIAGTVGYTVTGFFYGTVKALGNACIHITKFAKDFDLFDQLDSQLSTIFASFNTYFGNTGEGGFANVNSGLAGLAFILAGIIGMFYLMMGRMSKGIGWFVSMLLVFVIAFTLFSDMSGVLKTGKGITDMVATSVETSIGGDKDIYTYIANTMVVQPYNLLQYGESDPLAPGGIMEKNPTIYNYMITWNKSDVIMAGDKAGSLAEAKYDSDDLSENQHKLVAEDLAGESDVIIDIPILHPGIEGLTKDLLSDDGFSQGDADEPFSPDGVRTFDTCYENTFAHWGSAAGESLILFVMAFLLMLVLLALAGVQIAGQALVIVVCLIAIPVFVFALFRGLRPIINAFSVMVFGFLLTVIAATIRAITVLFIDLFMDISDGNLFIVVLLILMIGAVFWLFGPMLLGIFGINPTGFRAMRRMRRMDRRLKKLGRDKKSNNADDVDIDEKTVDGRSNLRRGGTGGTGNNMAATESATEAIRSDIQDAREQARAEEQRRNAERTKETATSGVNAAKKEQQHHLRQNMQNAANPVDGDGKEQQTRADRQNEEKRHSNLKAAETAAIAGATTIAGMKAANTAKELKSATDGEGANLKPDLKESSLHAESQKEGIKSKESAISAAKESIKAGEQATQIGDKDALSASTDEKTRANLRERENDTMKHSQLRDVAKDTAGAAVAGAVGAKVANGSQNQSGITSQIGSDSQQQTNTRKAMDQNGNLTDKIGKNGSAKTEHSQLRQQSQGQQQSGETPLAQSESNVQTVRRNGVIEQKRVDQVQEVRHVQDIRQTQRNGHPSQPRQQTQTVRHGNAQAVPLRQKQTQPVRQQVQQQVQQNVQQQVQPIQKPLPKGMQNGAVSGNDRRTAASQLRGGKAGSKGSNVRSRVTQMQTAQSDPERTMPVRENSSRSSGSERKIKAGNVNVNEKNSQQSTPKSMPKRSTQKSISDRSMATIQRSKIIQPQSAGPSKPQQNSRKPTSKK